MEKRVLTEIITMLLNDISPIVTIDPFSPLILELYYARIFSIKGIKGDYRDINPDNALWQGLFRDFMFSCSSLDLKGLCKKYGYELRIKGKYAFAVHESFIYKNLKTVFWIFYQT